MAIQIPNPGTGNGASGDNEFVLWSKVKDNFSDQTNAASKLVGAGANQVPTGRDIPLASMTWYHGGNITDGSYYDAVTKGDVRYVVLGGYVGDSTFPNGFSSGFINSALVVTEELAPTTERLLQRIIRTTGSSQGAREIYRTKSGVGAAWSNWQHHWTTENATKDPNGFLKGSSPIAEIYSDKMDLNDDAKKQGDITFEKLGVGDYLVKGSLGFAQEGWYIEMPKDANGNVLVAVVYEQLENNDLSVKTYAKRFDEETGDIVPNTTKPRDIPDGRFISLRLHEIPEDIEFITQPEEVDLDK